MGEQEYRIDPRLNLPTFFSLPVVIAVVSQVLAQLFKVVLYSLREQRLAFDRFVNAAGFPSAHSAFVVSLATAVGLRRGIESDLFAVAFVLAAVVVYDSFRLRGHVQRHAETINELLARDLSSSDGRPAAKGCSAAPVSEQVGHNLPEVAAGVLWGAAWAVILS